MVFAFYRAYKERFSEKPLDLPANPVYNHHYEHVYFGIVYRRWACQFAERDLLPRNAEEDKQGMTYARPACFLHSGSR
jgi:hypothetical protein